MAVADVNAVFGADEFGFGAGDGNHNVVLGQIQMLKPKLAQRADETAKAGWENFNPTGAHVGVFEPINFFRQIF